MRSCLIVVGLVACALFAVVQADCTAGNSCASCTAINGCGWCTATQTCTQGAPLGPTNGTCVGDYWVWGAGNCVDCGALTDCRQCMIWNQDCFWCINQASCLAIGTGLGCQQASSCPCDIYSRCSDCNYDAGCFWCSSNDTCQNQNTACNMPAHTCPCEANQDCSSCLGDDRCYWCNDAQVCKNWGYPCAPARDCTNFCKTNGDTCASCNNIDGCVWCADTLTCTDEKAATCMLTHTCPNCADHQYCDPCLDVSGCQWCDESETCLELTDNSCTFMSHSCTSYCSFATTCDSCNGMRGCAWCESGNCVDVASTNCLIAHSCAAAETCGFDGGAFVGGMFLSWGLLALGVGGWFFYRWKVANKRAYTELH